MHGAHGDVENVNSRACLLLVVVIEAELESAVIMKRVESFRHLPLIEQCLHPSVFKDHVGIRDHNQPAVACRVFFESVCVARFEVVIH